MALGGAEAVVLLNGWITEIARYKERGENIKG